MFTDGARVGNKPVLENGNDGLPGRVDARVMDRSWPKPVHRRFRSMQHRECSGDDMKCSEESYQQQIYETDPTNSPTINQSSPHRRTAQEPDGRRGGLPRHVRWTSRSHARRYVAEEGHRTYRKMLNLRPMRDGGIMSACKFTSRTRDCSIAPGGSR
jgi:hypothetical protein